MIKKFNKFLEENGASGRYHELLNKDISNIRPVDFVIGAFPWPLAGFEFWEMLHKKWQEEIK